MSETTNDTQAPADDRTADEIEADIAETRGRLAESVEALTARVDVKAQAKEKVVATSRSLVDRFKAASRPVQVAIGAAPLALLILIIVRRTNR